MYYFALLSVLIRAVNINVLTHPKNKKKKHLDAN